MFIKFEKKKKRYSLVNPERVATDNVFHLIPVSRQTDFSEWIRVVRKVAKFPRTGYEVNAGSNTQAVTRVFCD